MGIWWRRSWFSLNGKVSIQGSGKEQTSYTAPGYGATGGIHATTPSRGQTTPSGAAARAGEGIAAPSWPVLRPAPSPATFFCAQLSEMLISGSGPGESSLPGCGAQRRPERGRAGQKPHPLPRQQRRSAPFGPLTRSYTVVWPLDGCDGVERARLMHRLRAGHRRGVAELSLLRLSSATAKLNLIRGISIILLKFWNL